MSDVYRIPNDHGVRDESEAPRLVGLGFLLLPANDAFVGHEEKIPERVQGFGFCRLIISIGNRLTTPFNSQGCYLHDAVPISFQPYPDARCRGTVKASLSLRPAASRRHRRPCD